MEAVAIAQEKNRKYGDEEKYPDFLRGLSRAHAEALRQLGDVFAMVEKKALNPRLRCRAPAVLFADAGRQFADGRRKLAAGGLIHQAGQRLA